MQSVLSSTLFPRRRPIIDPRCVQYAGCEKQLAQSLLVLHSVALRSSLRTSVASLLWRVRARAERRAARVGRRSKCHVARARAGFASPWLQYKRKLARHLEPAHERYMLAPCNLRCGGLLQPDRKSTRLNSSHGYISYAVFCLKKKNMHQFTPLSMSTITFCLLSYVFQRCMIRMYNKFFVLFLKWPGAQSPNNFSQPRLISR